MTKFWAKYLDLLDKKPLQTRIITGFIISAIGDVISQITGGTKATALDIKRLLIFSSWGGFGFTPVGYNWYNLIESTVPANIPARFFWKMLMDQVPCPRPPLPSPVPLRKHPSAHTNSRPPSLLPRLRSQSVFPAFMTTVTFITLTVVEGLLDGFSLTLDGGLRSTGAAARGLPALFDEGVRKVRKELAPTLVANYKVWPLAQILNFAVVPVKLQVQPPTPPTPPHPPPPPLPSLERPVPGTKRLRENPSPRS